MNNRKQKKGIKMYFIWNCIENNGYTKHEARRLFKYVRKLSHLQEREARRLKIPLEGAWWDKLDNERLKLLV
jgi:hypothetical protein